MNCILFFEGLEIEIIKGFEKGKYLVIFEDEEFFYLKKDNKIFKIVKEGLIFKVRLKNKVFYIKGDYLTHKIKNRIKKIKKCL